MGAVALGELFGVDDRGHADGSFLPAPTGTLAEEAVDDGRDLPLHEREDVMELLEPGPLAGGRSLDGGEAALGDLPEVAVDATGAGRGTARTSRAGR